MPYLTTWTTANALGHRTLTSLITFLLAQYGDMPTENAPRGGNAFYVTKGKGGKGKGKGKGGKGKDKDNNRGTKRASDPTSLSSFGSSSSAPAAKAPRLTSDTTPALTAEHNPDRPYMYCWFHGWNFSHRGNTCKRIMKSKDPTRFNATSPTAFVEPAYKSWL
jgi:hypothetical protein